MTRAEERDVLDQDWQAKWSTTCLENGLEKEENIPAGV